MSPCSRIINSRLIRSNFYLGFSSHLGLDVGSSMTPLLKYKCTGANATHDTTTPTWLTSEVHGSVHVRPCLFLHRGYQGSVIGPELIHWPRRGSRPHAGAHINVRRFQCCLINEIRKYQKCLKIQF
uniref:Peptidase A1 domain-containing protein n=1 Tax=Mesocestoides corti TaxID=53468 RepID=A0A5K3FHA8_MESCO